MWQRTANFVGAQFIAPAVSRLGRDESLLQRIRNFTCDLRIELTTADNFQTGKASAIFAI